MSGKGKEEDQAPRALSHRDREDTDKRPSLAQQKRHSSSRDLTKHSVKDSSERSRYSLQYTKEPLRDKDSLKYKADKDYHRDKDAPLSARDSLKYTKDDPRDRDYHRDRDREPKSARDSLKYTKDTTQYNRSPYRDRDTANLGHYSSPRKDRDTAHRHYRESPLSARGSRKSTKDRDIEDKQSQDRDRDSGSNRGRDRGDSNKGGKEARSRSRGEDFRRSARNSFRYSVRESARDTESSLGMGEPTDFLLRCMIMESTYGVCLFDHVWSWKASDDETPSNSTANTLAKLVFSFFQISLSLKGTQKGQSSDPVSSSPGVSQVLFSDKQILAGRVQRERDGASRKIRMTTSNANGIIVTLFHKVLQLSPEEESIQNEKLEMFLSQLGAEFTTKYQKTYSKMKDKFKDLVSDIQKLPVTHAEVFTTFAEFKEPFFKMVEENGY